MKKNLNRITFIVALALGHNLKAMSESYLLTHQQAQVTRSAEEQKVWQTNEEIDLLLLNSAIAEPQFQEPALWQVLIRQYGIPLVYSYITIKTWFAQAYTSIKDALVENPKDETR